MSEDTVKVGSGKVIPKHRADALEARGIDPANPAESAKEERQQSWRERQGLPELPDVSEAEVEEGPLRSGQGTPQPVEGSSADEATRGTVVERSYEDVTPRTADAAAKLEQEDALGEDADADTKQHADKVRKTRVKKAGAGKELGSVRDHVVEANGGIDPENPEN